MIPTKQTVYIPVNGDYITAVCTFENDWVHQETVQPKEGYFFTPKQLNEYTANVIKQALDTASENAKTYRDKEFYMLSNVSKKSITNTFEETFKQFEV